MNCIVLLLPSDLDKEQAMLFKHLGEQGVGLPVDRSHVSSLVQYLNSSINSASVNRDVRKDVKKDIKAASALSAGQCIKPNRGGSTERASKCSEDPAGEARHRDSVEQHVSAVQKEKSKARDSSSPGAAAGAGVQYIGSRIGWVLI